VSTKKYSILWEDDEAVEFEINGVVYKNLDEIPNHQDMVKIMAMLNAAELDIDPIPTRRAGSSPEKLILNIFAGIAILMLLVTGFSVLSNIKKISAEETTSGIVVDIVIRHDYLNDQDRIIHEYSCPVVRFSAVDGRRRDVQMSACSDPPAFEIGDEVTVRYNPDKPLDARINSFGSNALMWVLPSITGILGLAFMGAVWLVRDLISSNETG